MPISKKRLNKISSISDSKISYAEIPELDRRFWSKAKLVRPKPKQAISVRIDSDVLDFFKKQGKGYQSLMNAVLKSYAESFNFKVRKRT